MRFITRDTDYAVRALVFMAGLPKPKTGTGKIITVDEIVASEPLPERFLRRILQKLAKNRILFSYKGKQGGFSFLTPPSKIKLTDIVNIFQGKVDLTNCLLKGVSCPNKNVCALRKKMKAINSAVIKELEKITISSLNKRQRNISKGG